MCVAGGAWDGRAQRGWWAGMVGVGDVVGVNALEVSSARVAGEDSVVDSVVGEVNGWEKGG